MSLYDLISHRHMVRDYQERALEQDKLERILNAALRSPSAGHAQGISLVVVQAQSSRYQISQLARESDWVERGYPAWLSSAPVHLLLCAEPEVYRQRYNEPDKTSSTKDWPVAYWYVDAGCMMMALLLAAIEEGLAAGFLGSHQLQALPQHIGLPSEVEFVGLITLGYANSQKQGHSARRGARPGRIHREKW